MRSGVVRGAEGTRGQQRMLRIDEPRDAMDRARLDRLVRIERRQDRGKRASEQRLPGARRPDEQEVVRAGRGDLERALRRLLADDVSK